MSAFLNSLSEEGTITDYIYWIGKICQEKQVHAKNLHSMTKDECFAELVRLYNLPKPTLATFKINSPLERITAWRTTDGQVFDKEEDAKKEQFFIDVTNATQGELQHRPTLELLWEYRLSLSTVFASFLPSTYDITFTET